MQIAEDLDSSDSKTCMQEGAILVNAVAANQGPLVQDAIEKAVNARMSVRKEAAPNCTAEVKADILILDPFHLELRSGNAHSFHSIFFTEV